MRRRRRTWLLATWLLACALALAVACREKQRSSGPTPSARPVAAPTASLQHRAVSTDERGEVGGLKYHQHVSGDVDDEAALPLVVALHGLGDDARNFSSLFDDVPIAARIVCLQAPEPYGRGFSWFPYRIGVADEELAPALREAADRVAQAIAALSQEFPLAPRTLVTGFSQGGMLSFAVAVLHPTLVQASLPIAGYLPQSLSASVDGEGAPPIFAFHGSADDVVEYRAAVETELRLRAQGFRVNLARYEGVAHGVSPRMKDHVHARIVHALRSPLMARDEANTR